MANSGNHAGNGHAGNGHEKNPRWQGIERPYSSADVARLRPSIHIEHTLARLGAERLWQLFHAEPYVPALGALTGNQAVQQVQAGLKAIYLSGWQVAGDANARRPDVSGSEPVSRQQRARRWCARINNSFHARRPDPPRRKASPAPTGSRPSWRMRRPVSAAL